MNNKNHLFEFLTGILVGVGLGLLFAPSPGKDLRKKVKTFIDENQNCPIMNKEKTENLIQKTKKSIEDGFDNLSKIIDEKKKIVNKDNTGTVEKKA
ncbi:MAG: YtxH domain-containing protein [Candidatus Margulisiibacteriota bacterium]|jgi:gas vesicle protein